MHLEKTTQDNHTDTFLNSFDSQKQIKRKKILDVGCGHGYASRQFLEKEASLVHAMDIVPRVTEESSKPFYLQKTPIQFFTNWDDVLKKGEKYDLIWHHHVIEHIEDYFSFLRTIHSILSDQGWMWFACPNMANHSVYSPGHIQNFQAAQLVEALKRTGFGVEDIRVWALNGQLRIRVPKNASNEYPLIMKEALHETGRCPSELLSNWRWK